MFVAVGTPAVVGIGCPYAPGATGNLSEARAIGERMGELQRLSPAIWGLAETARLRGDHGLAIELCERGVAASELVADAAADDARFATWWVHGVVALFWVLVPPVIDQTQALIRVLPEYIQNWERGLERLASRFPALQDAVGEGTLLRAVYEAPSVMAINPLQDLLGSRERVNVPGTVADTRGIDYFFSISDGATTSWWPGTSSVDGYVPVGAGCCTGAPTRRRRGGRCGRRRWRMRGGSPRALRSLPAG